MFDRCARGVLFLTVFVVALPGCSRIHKRGGNIVKVDLRRNPTLARKLNAKAAVHLQREDFGKAEPLLRRALKADRTCAPAHNNLGLLYFSRFDLFRAALSFQEAMRFNPESPEPQNNLGLTFEAAGRPQSAVEHYHAAYELSPTDPQFLGNLIRARIRADEPVDSMREELRQLLFIERRPDWIEWIEEQLELVTNPYLDRGPESPELGEIGSGTDASSDPGNRDRVIYDGGPPAVQPGSMTEPFDQTPLRDAPAIPGDLPHEPQPTPELFSPPRGAPKMPATGPMGSVPLRIPPVQAGWEQPTMRSN